ncbi:MAG: hypothetical protein AAFP89_26130 [Bacteroidota bacterium]
MKTTRYLLISYPWSEESSEAGDNPVPIPRYRPSANYKKEDFDRGLKRFKEEFKHTYRVGDKWNKQNMDHVDGEETWFIMRVALDFQGLRKNSQAKKNIKIQLSDFFAQEILKFPDFEGSHESKEKYLFLFHETENLGNAFVRQQYPHGDICRYMNFSGGVGAIYTHLLQAVPRQYKEDAVVKEDGKVKVKSEAFMKIWDYHWDLWPNCEYRLENLKLVIRKANEEYLYERSREAEEMDFAIEVTNNFLNYVPEDYKRKIDTSRLSKHNHIDSKKLFSYDFRYCEEDIHDAFENLKAVKGDEEPEHLVQELFNFATKKNEPSEARIEQSLTGLLESLKNKAMASASV